MPIKPAPENRLFQRVQASPGSRGKYVLYWMQMHRRLEYNFGLQHAAYLADEWNCPLLIYEGLRPDYPFASARFHGFILDGMAEHMEYFDSQDLLLSGHSQAGTPGNPGSAHYLPFVPRSPEEARGFLKQLCAGAKVVVSDEFPVFIIPEQNRALEDKLKEDSIPFLTVDSNGIIPLKESSSDPYSAYLFRKVLQKRFSACYRDFPEKQPLKRNQKHKLSFSDLQLRSFGPALESTVQLLRSWSAKRDSRILSPYQLDEGVSLLESGTRKAGLNRMKAFVKEMPRYTEMRNDPDAAATSGLSPFLHFGRISIYELVKQIFSHYQLNDSWKGLIYNNGSRGFFPGPPEVDAFLDEALTWRETGYHFCHHRPDYAEFNALPDWARKTLLEHRTDEREYIYSLDQLENAETHDEIWNAAQRQLKQSGIIHNYLRMLWGKKILEWTDDPRKALEITLHLNNKYSIDGRNPNSYSGVFWIFGRFDRPWQERPIFGKIRYMSSEQTRKKVKLKQYLERFGSENQGRLL
ncbi:MAG: hypothetical protein CMF59_01200 [Leptospiraceae bacterium]|nr:hypothetical protein [Leptospiraceae bacterium]